MGKRCVSSESASHCSVCAVVIMLSYSKNRKEGAAGGVRRVSMIIPAWIKGNTEVRHRIRDFASVMKS